MNRKIAGFILGAGVWALVGWGSTYSENKPPDKGVENSNRTRQENDEIVKRTQGDESGQGAIHMRGPLQDDDRGRF